MVKWVSQGRSHRLTRGTNHGLQYHQPYQYKSFTSPLLNLFQYLLFNSQAHMRLGGKENRKTSLNNNKDDAVQEQKRMTSKNKKVKKQGKRKSKGKKYSSQYKTSLWGKNTASKYTSNASQHLQEILMSSTEKSQHKVTFISINMTFF